MKQLDDAVLGVLSRCRVDGDKVFLPEQLDRQMYLNVNKALDAIGGKWDRREKAHLFPHPIDVEFSQMLLTGVMPKRNELSFFATPLGVGSSLVEMVADVAPGWADGVVSEPSAGVGHLVKVIIGAGVDAERIDAMEIDAFRWGLLTEVLPHARQGDFLAYKPAQRYSAVICNPPFNTPGMSNAWVDHVNRAAELGDVVGAIVPRSIEFGSGKIAKLRARCVAMRDLPDGAFAESGTLVKTSMIVVQG